MDAPCSTHQGRAVQVQKGVKVISMHKYELMFMVRPDVDEETLKATREKIQAIITKNEGKISHMNDIGKRRLAYMIDKYREGIYSVYTFKADAHVVNELDHVINIDENILRRVTVNLDKK
jgi:small subunit ribosomal protein S6